MFYPARFEPAEEGGFVVTFRDIPEAITQGDNKEEAIDMARDALRVAVELYLEDKRAIPLPSAVEPGEELVELYPGIPTQAVHSS
jgi:antitoxin HicB